MSDLILKIWVIIILDFVAFGITTYKTNRTFFNPKENYEVWSSLNWFGVWFFTVCYWIVFLPITIYSLIEMLFTVGRR